LVYSIHHAESACEVQNIVDIIESNLVKFTLSTDVEVQERACFLAQFLKEYQVNRSDEIACSFLLFVCFVFCYNDFLTFDFLSFLLFSFRPSCSHVQRVRSSGTEDDMKDFARCCEMMFAEVLNPVSPSAQARVPIPEGVNGCALIYVVFISFLFFYIAMFVVFFSFLFFASPSHFSDCQG
jgi:hypothetical protein